VSLNPIALVTATSVDSRGLPWTDNARQRLSRLMPAALADFGDALDLSEVAQGNEQNAGLVFIFQCRFEILGG